MTMNSESTAIAVPDHRAELATIPAFTEDRIQLLKRTMADGKMTDDELALFIEVAKRTGLDPFRKQIYAFLRGDKLTIQTGIDGFRAIAERSGKYEGQLGPFWCGEDGKWVDVWLTSKPPVAAKVGILRKGFREPIWGVARFGAYAQKNLWLTMGEVMIAKVAEALGIRKAFPEDASQVYIEEEMEQADSPTNGDAMRSAVIDRAERQANGADQPKPTDHAAAVASADTLEKLQLAIDAIKADLKAGRISAVVANTLAGATRARREKLEAKPEPAKSEPQDGKAAGEPSPGPDGDDPDNGP